MTDSRKSLLPTLLVASSGIAASPVGAIELGEISVQSTLGEPLRASISYALAGNEALADYCVSIQAAPSSSGLPSIRRADVSVADGIIRLSGNNAVREPLSTIRLDVRCPYTPNVSREYLLMIDPATPLRAAAAEPAVTPAAAPVRVAASRPASRRPASTVAARPAVTRAPIETATRYRVQPGDSLSAIAQRIENRPVGLWTAVNQIFDANPDAFVDDDPNRLKAGSWLLIPEFPAGLDMAAATFPTAAAVDSQQSLSNAAEPVSTPVSAGIYEPPAALTPAAGVSSAPAVADDTAVLLPATPEAVATGAAAGAAPRVDIAGRDLVPGDIVLNTELEPAAESSSPNVAVANLASDRPTERPGENVEASGTATAPAVTAWLYALVGGGIVLLGGLLAFGRRRRNRPHAAPAAATATVETLVEHPMRRVTDTSEVEVIEMQPVEPVIDVDYALEDDSPTEENLALDADLILGTGLDAGTEIDVAEDFAFAGSIDLDLELPDDGDSDSAPQTDIIAPPTADTGAILESEVLPDDDEYDMSVVVDATRIQTADEFTEHDLKAVVVDTMDGTLVTDNYTISQEVDYQILEQDHEDELTATQALNLEIERAAAEFADRMDEHAGDDAAEVDSDADDKTAEMPLATVTPIDATASLPARADDDSEDAERTEEIAAADKTAEMPAAGCDDADATAEITAKMTIESGKVDTKAG